MTPEGLAKVIKVDYFVGKIATRLIEKDDKTGEEVFSQEVSVYFKNEIKRLGKNENIVDKENDEMLDEVTANELDRISKDW